MPFEDIFFACLPVGLFLVLSPSLFFQLLQKPILLSVRPKLLTSKLIVLTVLLGLQLTFLVLRSLNLKFKTNASVAADSLSLVATGLVLALSFMSRQRSARPSTLVSLYLSMMVILCVARARTVWLLEPRDPVPVVMTLIFVSYVVALFVESIEKGPNITKLEKKTGEACAPEQRSGFWARTCFTWLAATFWRGYSKVISVGDLPVLDSKLDSSILRENLMETWGKYNSGDRYSLLRACFRSFFFSAISPIIPRLCLTIFTFSQPFLIKTTVAFVGLKSPDSNYGKGLIGAWALVYLGIAVSNSVYQYQNFRFTTRLRGGLVAVVYQRTVEIREVDRGDITGVALMSTDVERIIRGMQVFHEVWASLLDVVVASWLLGEQIFLACLAPILLVVVFIGITSRVSFSIKRAQLRWIEKVQERLRVTTTLLGEIKSVKMLGLTQVMSAIVQRCRVDEINTSKRFRKLLVLTLLLSLTPINLAPTVTFSIYVIISVFWKNETLLTAQAFTSVALISLLTTPVVVFIQALPMVVQCISSFDRIREYCNYDSSLLLIEAHTGLVTDEIELEVNHRSSILGDDTQSVQPLMENHAIAFEDDSFAWDKEGVVALKNLSVKIAGGSVTAIVGPVGSGKSAFLNAILGEMMPISTTSAKFLRKALTTQTVAYCSQQAWLENKSIYRNIIGDSAYDRSWYETVKWACNLDVDIKQLHNGDDTNVGSNGLNLSGGQKQRIALARAFYSRNSIIILDDVFSGMDANTANIVSFRLFGGQGLARKSNMTVVIATHSHKIMSLMDMIIAFEDGKIVESGSPSALLVSKGYDENFWLKPQSLENTAESNREDQDPEISRETSNKDGNIDTTQDNQHLQTDFRRKNGDILVYKYYLASAGYITVGLYTFALVIWIFCTEFSTVWIKWWSETNTAHPNQNVGMYVGLYAMLGVIATLAASLTAWLAFVNIISNTAANIHSDLLNSMVAAPFRFFANTDSGELLNRFGEDMELIDMDLPSVMVNYTSSAATFMGQIIILAVFSQYLGISLPILGAVLFFVQRFYLQTSRQVRLLGIEARAPLYAHFTESVAGAATIRAFGWQMHYQKRNYEHINNSQRPNYLQSCIQTWLAFVLNMLVAALAVILVSIVVTWHGKFNAGSVGVNLTIVISFSGTLSRLIQNWTKLESSVGAVARVKRFTAETKAEEITGRGASLTSEWPQAGAVNFSGVTSSYGPPNTEKVLKSVSLSIPPGQHIAICGRSGSGKSSLLLSLLQMIDVVEGKITVDGVDIATVLQQDVRSNINVVPQDPLLIPGTIRCNIDPFAISSDADITRALKKVRLWSAIQEQGGLDKEIGDTNFSAGQKQLLCLARATVKRSKILVLDEAMSSVDNETESIMQEIVDSEFRGCTVLAVMHRLRHISHYDKVALLDNGTLLEYDQPGSLLERNSRFADLFKMNGH